LLDVILVNLAALKVLLRAFGVLVAHLLKHLLVKIDPFVFFEIRLEVDGI
jgi:hypothetical protein